MATRRKLSGWWKRIAGIWLVVFILTTLAYSMGATKVSKAGASINIDRSADYSLYKLNDTAAIYYQPKYNSLSLVSYKKAFPLFRMLGDYEYGGEILNEPLARKGDWYYLLQPAYYDKGRVIAYNAQTGEKLLKQENSNPESTAPPAGYPEHDFELNENLALRPETVAANYPPLSVPKESAIVTIGGLMLAGILWLLVLPFAFRKVVVAS